MNPTKKKFLMYAGGAATALTLGSGMLATSALAASDAAAPDSPASSLISKLATKFGVSESEVKAVFDEDRSEKHAEMKTKAVERLAQAVTDGELTQAQKDLIVAKQAELEAARESARTEGTKPTAEEMKAQRDALKQWATDNDIDMKWLMGGFGGPGKHGRGGFGGPRGERPADAPESETAR